MNLLEARAARLTALGLLVLIAFLSLTPSPGHVDGGNPLLRALAELFLGDPSQHDKIGHFLAYAALGAAGAAALAGRIGAAVLGATAYGALMELGQLLVPGRSAGFGDLLADLLGAIAGVFFFLALRRLSRGVRPWSAR